MTTQTTTAEALKKLHHDLCERAAGFHSHQGLFSGQFIADEMRRFAVTVKQLICDAEEANEETARLRNEIEELTCFGPSDV